LWRRASAIQQVSTAMIAVSAVLALGASLPGTTARAAVFSGSYASERSIYGAVRDCANVKPFIGSEPESMGRFPVFVYLPAPIIPYDGVESRTIIDSAMRKGFVAASVPIAEWQGYAEGIDGNARCIFDGTSSRSALAQLCARPKADCSRRGVVVAGFSEGAAVAVRARNHDPRTRAAYLLGFNEAREWFGSSDRWTMSVVPPAGTRALPNSRIRILNGMDDAPVDRRDELNDQTGRACAVSRFVCLAPGGSGWYVVQHYQLADGYSDHYYFHEWRPSYVPPFDPTWIAATDAVWALQPNLDWLKRFTRR
jgi:hypothetical protein